MTTKDEGESKLNAILARITELEDMLKPNDPDQSLADILDQSESIERAKTLSSLVYLMETLIFCIPAGCEGWS